MSRIGKLPISVPTTVKVKLDKNTITVDGPKGKLIKDFNPAVVLKLESNELVVTPANASRFARAMQGTARSIIANMVQGVIEGYSKDIEIKGVGFRAAVKGTVLNLLLGYSHPINYPIPESITITVTENTKIKVEGIDKQKVGAVAADLKHFYKPEPYKGKGVHIIGEYVRRKEGKTVG